MSTAILEQRARIAEDGTLLLHLPENLRGQEVDVQVRHLVPMTETELIAKINRPLAAPVRQRYEVLVAKRKDETLTTDEYDELQALTDVVEEDHLRRWEYLGRLAALQGLDLMRVAARYGLVREN